MISKSLATAGLFLCFCSIRAELFHRLHILWLGIWMGEQNPAGHLEENRLLDGIIEIFSHYH